ncbi:MAG TPA: helix-turn-helix transcriptional regulator [Bacteroidales bacterium]|nr:helix-turn-helix transcriptional regulator [Bacteroidales bacterium]HOX77865.1 helix-turn-helix transcriptional regulator [Bacteroidales bacterium]
MKKNNSTTKTWSTIKDEVFGIKGTERRDGLEREMEAIRIGLMIREARLAKNMTQQELADLISKKRSYISRIEKDGSNMNLKTLYEIIEKGLGGKLEISIELK